MSNIDTLTSGLLVIPLAILLGLAVGYLDIPQFDTSTAVNAASTVVSAALTYMLVKLYKSQYQLSEKRFETNSSSDIIINHENKQWMDECEKFKFELSNVGQRAAKNIRVVQETGYTGIFEIKLIYSVVRHDQTGVPDNIIKSGEHGVVYYADMSKPISIEPKEWLFSSFVNKYISPISSPIGVNWSIRYNDPVESNKTKPIESTFKNIEFFIPESSDSDDSDHESEIPSSLATALENSGTRIRKYHQENENSS